MKTVYVNPPFKSEYGKFSRESRSPSIGHSGVLYYPLWMIYSAAILEDQGFDISFYDACAKPLSKEETLERINAAKDCVELFVINTSTPSIYSDVSFAQALKERYPDSFILLVGTHPSSLPEETLSISQSIDGIARKEYDAIVLELAKALDAGADVCAVKGLSYRDSEGNVVHNEDMDPIEDMDTIPFAARFIKEHLDVDDYVFPAAALPEIQIFTGRGCPARCSFCVYPQTMHGHKYRARSAENVVGEFEYIVRELPQVREIVIEDDTFTIDEKRVRRICELLIEKGLNKKTRWLCNARINLSYETMVLMKEAGCHLIIPGIESYNQEILNNIRKGATLNQIDTYIANAKRAGLKVHACYMVGNKGETRETMENTLEAALRFNTDTAQFFPLIPYPGTEAYSWAKENGYIDGLYENYLQEDGTLNCVINLPGISSREFVDFCSQARRKYYMRPSYIAYRIKEGLKDPNDLKRSLKAFGTLKRSLFNKQAENEGDKSPS